jgi:hypothetical protein
MRLKSAFSLGGSEGAGAAEAPALDALEAAAEAEAGVGIFAAEKRHDSSKHECCSERDA